MKMSSTLALPVIAAVVVGLSLALQPVFNNNMSRSIGLFNAALCSMLVTAVFVISIGFYTDRFRGLKNFGEVNKLYLLAGLCGAAILVLMIYALSRLGPAMTYSITVATQMSTAAVLSHYGWFNLPQVPITSSRVLGIVFLILGVVLIKGSK